MQLSLRNAARPSVEARRRLRTGSRATTPDLYRYLSSAASPEIALRYTDALIGHCEALETLPERGTRRDDIRPGLRLTNYRERTTIAFTVQSERVEILRIFHAGRNYAALLQPEDDRAS